MDRALATPTWLDLFPNHWLSNKHASISNHVLLLLTTYHSSLVPNSKNFGLKILRYLTLLLWMWLGKHGRHLKIDYYWIELAGVTQPFSLGVRLSIEISGKKLGSFEMRL